MAKTRIKTTPTRFQKDALTAEDIKKRLRQVSSTQSKSKEALSVIASVLVAPKRTNSISSATSSISLASDAYSANSDSNHATTDSVLATLSPATQTAAAQSCPSFEPHHISDTLTTTTTTTTTKSLSCLLNKQIHNNNSALKNRKVFMITERCGDDQDSDTIANGSNSNNTNGNIHSLPTAPKRKMYLIMEETPQPQQNDSLDTNDSSSKNDFSGNMSKKKLTLFADKCDTQLTQKFEQILPEILQRINNKVNRTQTSKGSLALEQTTVKQQNGENPKPAMPLCQPRHEQAALVSQAAKDATPLPEEQPARPPITLPPKKNRMKIINTTSPVKSAAVAAAAAAATTVIVSPTPLLTTTGTKNSLAGSAVSGNTGSSLQPHQKNINLTTDFLFLMKMLPKLEAIPEPHKNHVKNCIEKIVTQNASVFQE